MQSPPEFKTAGKERLAEEFTNGRVLLFNKPMYWTSFDLVNKVKYILKHRLDLKKIKVGHAGTLDPLATGLMIICTGKETRNIENYQARSKEYLAKIHLGATTPSFDLETDINMQFPVEHINRDNVERTLAAFKGSQLQKPPDYSARFVNGTRAYKLARKGEAMELQPREIMIHEISLVSFNMPLIEIKIICSKGTYVRSIARDVGERLGSGAYLSGLIRTGIGNFLLHDAFGIDEFERNFIFL